jgi:hypothetical protein
MKSSSFLVGVLFVGMSTLAHADTRLATIPNDCSSGALLVSQGGGNFSCVSPSRALQLSGCHDGDFVTMSSSGELACQGISSTTWSVKALLPNCSSGQVLQSEGFGSWRCVSPSSLNTLPSCSSGETIVMDGGSWRCTTLKK